MQIFVKLLHGQTADLWVEPTDNLGEITKKYIRSAVAGIDPNEYLRSFYLTWGSSGGGRPLNYKKTIQENEIESNMTISECYRGVGPLSLSDRFYYTLIVEMMDCIAGQFLDALEAKKFLREVLGGKVLDPDGFDIIIKNAIIKAEFEDEDLLFIKKGIKSDFLNRVIHCHFPNIEKMEQTRQQILPFSRDSFFSSNNDSQVSHNPPGGPAIDGDFVHVDMQKVLKYSIRK